MRRSPLSQLARLPAARHGAFLALFFVTASSSAAQAALPATPPTALPPAVQVRPPLFRPSASMTPSQLGESARLQSLPANRSEPPSSFVVRQPLLNRLSASLRTRIQPTMTREQVDTFVRAQQERLGPLTTLKPTSFQHYGAFVTEKALALNAFGRTPADVTETFVKASGSVDGQRIEDREIFVQHWSPVGANPTGKVFVVSPGYQETGRSFYEQVDMLTRKGNDVFVMDQQWAGYSGGRPGAIDRGFGVARDVASVSAYANQFAKAQYPSGNQVILFGNSMGAGPGVVGALALNDAGKIALDGPSMPQGLSAILQAPYLRSTPSLLNRTLTVASHVPGLRDLPMPASGLPPLTSDHVAQARFSEHATMDDVKTRLSAFSAATPDLKTIAANVPSIRGRVYVVQSEHDELADTAATREFVATLSSRAKLETVAGKNHVLEESPATETDAVLNGVAWVAK
jgi:pimeloyl-ACP methyl ester carboxylesterase